MHQSKVVMNRCRVKTHLCGKRCKLANKPGCLNACTQVTVMAYSFPQSQTVMYPLFQDVAHTGDHLCASTLHTCGEVRKQVHRCLFAHFDYFCLSGVIYKAWSWLMADCIRAPTFAAFLCKVKIVIFWYLLMTISQRRGSWVAFVQWTTLSCNLSTLQTPLCKPRSSSWPWNWCNSPLRVRNILCEVLDPCLC